MSVVSTANVPHIQTKETDQWFFRIHRQLSAFMVGGGLRCLQIPRYPMLVPFELCPVRCPFVPLCVPALCKPHSTRSDNDPTQNVIRNKSIPGRDAMSAAVGRVCTGLRMRFRLFIALRKSWTTMSPKSRKEAVWSHRSSIYRLSMHIYIKLCSWLVTTELVWGSLIMSDG